MSQYTTPQPFDLVHHPGQVFDRLTTDAVDNSMVLHYMLVECYFVLPRRPREEGASFPILSVTHARPDGEKDVFLQLGYEHHEQRFLVAANAGSRQRELRELELEDAPAHLYTGRLLHAFVLVARTGLYPSIEDALAQSRELFGELELDQGGEHPPWGKPPSGTWCITSCAPYGLEQYGLEADPPPDFGLCDLRVTVFDDWDAGFRSMPYSGALDHLVDHSEQDPPHDAEDVSIGPALLKLAEDVRVMAGGFSAWVRRARDLAEETEQLGRQAYDLDTPSHDPTHDEEAELPY